MYKISLVFKDMDNNVVSETDLVTRFTKEFEKDSNRFIVLEENNLLGSDCKNAYIELLLRNIKDSIQKEDVEKLMDGIKKRNQEVYVKDGYVIY